MIAINIHPGNYWLPRDFIIVLFFISLCNNIFITALSSAATLCRCSPGWIIALLTHCLPLRSIFRQDQLPLHEGTNDARPEQRVDQYGKLELQSRTRLQWRMSWMLDAVFERRRFFLVPECPDLIWWFVKALIRTLSGSESDWIRCPSCIGAPAESGAGRLIEIDEVQSSVRSAHPASMQCCSAVSDRLESDEYRCGAADFGEGVKTATWRLTDTGEGWLAVVD